MPQTEDEEGLPIKYKINNLEGGSLPLFIKYNELSKSLTVKSNDEKDIGTYSLEMCITDGFALPVCEKFTLTVEVPINNKKQET
jgi:hypothetical protein